MAGMLFLIPSSLGPTPWAAYLPAETRDIACRLSRFIVENAKTARAELKRLGHPLPMREIRIEQLPERISPADAEFMLAPVLAGEDAGLLSEAGCPGVADPGALLVRRAHSLNIAVRPLVGPSSLLMALMASGLEGQRFAFHGYLPVREPERARRLVELEHESQRFDQTQICIEAPYRNDALLHSMLAVCQPGTQLCIATDLTTATEEIATYAIAEWRRRVAPKLDRRPTVFLLLSGR
jgi:16S rRNA (cytidine1402-2'-O)-methyltransferase